MNYKYKNQVQVVYPEEFLRWLYYELYNMYKWNEKQPNCIGNFSPRTVGLECSLEWKDTWKVEIRERRVYFYSNTRFFSVHKGLKFNTANGQIIIT